MGFFYFDSGMPPLRQSSVSPPSGKQDLAAVEDMYFRSGVGAYAKKFFPALRRLVRASSDSVMVTTNLLRFFESTFNLSTLLTDLSLHTVLLETLVKIFGTSQYLADIVIRDPELFRWLTATNVLEKEKSHADFSFEARQSIAPFQSSLKKVNALKRFQRRELLRIGVRDILGLSDIRRTTTDLSSLADSIVRIVGDIVWAELCAQGAAPAPSSWVIFGLGKLGGMELNYSSDIDLLAVYNIEEAVARSTEATDVFYLRLIERTVHTLSEVTEEGFLYRVDMRLRPDGGAGPLIHSLPAIIAYYESRGEIWERQMLVKARCVAGDEELGRRCLNALSPFVYPRTSLDNPIQEISRIKTRIETKPENERNIKLCPGGIRDIEFVVQALQLLNGGREKNVRNGNTLAAVDALADAKVLSTRESKVLVDAYVFFRYIEHRLQMLTYAQTHLLPASKTERIKLAKRLGLKGPSFEKKVHRCRSQVRKIFDNVFSSRLPTPSSDLERLLFEEVDSDFSRKWCLENGFKNRKETKRRIQLIMYGSSLRGKKTYTEHTRILFGKFSREFVALLARSPSPDWALEQCELAISASPSVDSFFALLTERKLLQAFVSLCGRSSMLTRRFVQFPDLAELTFSNIDDILKATRPTSPIPRSLHRWKIYEEMKAAVRYILLNQSEKELFSELSGIAVSALSMLYEHEREKAGLPQSTEFCIVALGKLGGREMNFYSDLDLLFLCSSSKKTDMTKCEALAQRLIEEASRETAYGTLCRIDARLRPEGRNAPLCVDSETYFEYLRHRASLWERQSLTKAIVLVQDDAFGDSIGERIRNFVYRENLPHGWQHQVVAMRKRTESRSRVSSKDYYDIKLGPGGLMDIEFCAQSIQLAGRGVSNSTNTYEVLDAYADRPLVQTLRESYSFLRRIEVQLQIGLDRSSSVIPGDKEKAELLSRLLGFESLQMMMDLIHVAMKANRKIFETLMPDIS